MRVNLMVFQLPLSLAGVEAAVYDEFKHEGLLRSLLLRDCNDERLAMLIVAQSLDAKTEAKYKELAVKFNIKRFIYLYQPL